MKSLIFFEFEKKQLTKLKLQRQAKKSRKQKEDKTVRLGNCQGKEDKMNEVAAAWRREEKTKKQEENYRGVQSFSNFMFRPLEFNKTINTPKSTL